MAKIELASARTDKTDPTAAAEALVSGLGGGEPKLVTLFAARDHDHAALNRAVRERLPKKTRLIGASTGGEVDNRGMHNTPGALLGAFSGDFEVGLGLGKGLTDDAMAAGSHAMKRAREELGLKAEDVRKDRHVGVVIDDGFRWKKEELLLGVLDENPDALLVGGGAASYRFADEPNFAIVHVDGEVATDAALVALFQTEANFAALRTHWYHPTGQMITITKVDESHQRALEIDGKPAAARYAELLGIEIDDLEFGKPKGFVIRPTALKVGKEYFLRAPWKPLPDGSILFANLLEAGSKLELMQIGDLAETTRSFFKNELPARVPNPTAALFFHCGARAFYSASAGKADALGAAFADAPPCVGFNVHFEIYCGFHINTTLTALAFGESA